MLQNGIDNITSTAVQNEPPSSTTNGANLPVVSETRFLNDLQALFDQQVTSGLSRTGFAGQSSVGRLNTNEGSPDNFSAMGPNSQSGECPKTPDEQLMDLLQTLSSLLSELLNKSHEPGGDCSGPNEDGAGGDNGATGNRTLSLLTAPLDLGPDAVKLRFTNG